MEDEIKRPTKQVKKVTRWASLWTAGSPAHHNSSAEEHGECTQSMLRYLCFHIMALIFSEQDDFLCILRLASLVLKAFLSFTF